jgi:alpha-glucosidase (family GH31 glycosyl hydrolase)
MLSEYPLDKAAYELDDQFLLGDVLLVRPVMEAGVKKVNIYLPSTAGD